METHVKPSTVVVIDTRKMEFKKSLKRVARRMTGANGSGADAYGINRIMP
jgi:hypothetical protein